MEMSLNEIINDRKSGLIAPSEIERRKKQLEARKSGLNSETKSKLESEIKSNYKSEYVAKE